MNSNPNSPYCHHHFTAAPLATNIPLRIKSAGAYVRTDSTPGAATAGNGDGSSLAEQYVAYNPGNLASSDPVQLGQTAILRSRLTGKFCKLTLLPGSSQQGMVCDQDSEATATVFTYTGIGLSYNNQPLVAGGPGQPLVLPAAGSPPAANADPDLSFSPVGESSCCMSSYVDSR